MKKIFLGILFLLGLSVYGQVVNSSVLNNSLYESIKSQVSSPGNPTSGYVRLYVYQDSLHFKNSVKDWNLGRMARLDTLSYYLLRTDTTYFLHNVDLKVHADTLGAYLILQDSNGRKDSILLKEGNGINIIQTNDSTVTFTPNLSVPDTITELTLNHSDTLGHTHLFRPRNLILYEGGGYLKTQDSVGNTTILTLQSGDVSGDGISGNVITKTGEVPWGDKSGDLLFFTGTSWLRGSGYLGFDADTTHWVNDFFAKTQVLGDSSMRLATTGYVKRDFMYGFDFNQATVWDAGINYQIKDVVSFDVGTYLVYYQCKKAHLSTGTAPYDMISKWSLIGYFTNPVMQFIETGVDSVNWLAQDKYGATLEAIAKYIEHNALLWRDSTTVIATKYDLDTLSLHLDVPVRDTGAFIRSYGLNGKKDSVALVGKGGATVTRRNDKIIDVISDTAFVRTEVDPIWIGARDTVLYKKDTVDLLGTKYDLDTLPLHISVQPRDSGAYIKSYGLSGKKDSIAVVGGRGMTLTRVNDKKVIFESDTSFLRAEEDPFYFRDSADLIRDIDYSAISDDDGAWLRILGDNGIRDSVFLKAGNNISIYRMDEKAILISSTAPDSLSGGTSYGFFKKITIDKTGLESLANDPYELLPSPGPGNFIDVISSFAVLHLRNVRTDTHDDFISYGPFGSTYGPHTIFQSGSASGTTQYLFNYGNNGIWSWVPETRKFTPYVLGGGAVAGGFGINSGVYYSTDNDVSGYGTGSYIDVYLTYNIKDSASGTIINEQMLYDLSVVDSSGIAKIRLHGNNDVNSDVKLVGKGQTVVTKIASDKIEINTNVISIQDSLGAVYDSLYQQRYILTSHSGTLSTHTGLLSNLQDSIDRHTDTLQVHRSQIAGKQATIPASTLPNFYSWDKTYRAVDWSYIANRPDEMSAWQLGSDSTLNALYPVNIAALKAPPDSRVTIGYMPIHDALNGDTLDFNLMIGDRRFQFFSVADGAQGSGTGGINIIGKINGSYSALWDSAYVNRVTHFYEGLRKTGVNVRTYAPEIEHDSLKGYIAAKHFFQKAIDTVNTSLSGLLKSTAGVLSIRPDSTIQYNLAYTKRVNSWTLPLRITSNVASIDSATTSAPGAMSAWDKTKLAGIAVQANKYVHPNHSGAVTSTGDGATVITDKAVTLAKMSDMATASLIYRRTAATGVPEVNTLATLKTDLGLASSNSGDNSPNSLYSGSIGLWRKDSAQTLNALFPVNISSLKVPTDSRVTAWNLVIRDALNGDTVGVNGVIGGKQSFFHYAIPDGAGGASVYGTKLRGNLLTDSLESANVMYGKKLRLGTQDYISNSFDSTDQKRPATMYALLQFGNSKWGSGSGSGEINTASNLGDGYQFYKSKVTYDLQFRTLKSSASEITFTTNTNDITLNFDHSALANAADLTAHASLLTGIHGLNITAGKQFNLSNTLTFSGTDGSTLNIGTGGTLGTGAYVTIANYRLLTNHDSLSTLDEKSYNSLTDKPTTMTPASHTHGNITNAGLIGTTANLPIITGTGGILQAGSFGTGANTFMQGNDSRVIASARNFLLTPDSTLNTLFPLNISSLKMPPDSRITIANMPNWSAPYGDTLEYNYVIGGKPVFRAYYISDGAGGALGYGIMGMDGSYLPLSGGTLTGDVTMTGTKAIIFQGTNGSYLTASRISNIGSILSISHDRGGGTNTSLGLSTDISFNVNSSARASLSSTLFNMLVPVAVPDSVYDASIWATSKRVPTKMAVKALIDAATTPQIQSDWTQTNNTLLDYIKNKPTIPAVQVQTDWNATSGLGVLLNKPTIPSITGLVTTSQSTPQTIGSTGSRLVKLWADDLTVTNGINITGSISANGLMVGSGASATGLIYGNKASGTGNLLSLSYGGTERVSINYQGNATFAGAVLGSNLNITAWNDLVTFPGFGTDHTHAAYGDHSHAGVYLTSLTGAVLTDQSTPQTIGTTGARLTKMWATDLTVTNAISGSITSANSLKSPSTTGIMQVTGMSALQTRVKTVSDLNDTFLELGGSYSPTGAWTLTGTTFAGTKVDFSAIDSTLIKIRGYSSPDWQNSHRPVSEDAFRDLEETNHPTGSEIVRKAYVTLSAAEINSLHTSPKTVIAVDAGYALEVISCSCNYTAVTQSYNTNYNLYLGTGTADDYPQYTFLAALYGASSFTKGDNSTGSLLYTNMFNGGDLILYVATGNPTGPLYGNGTCKIYISYRIITL